MNARRDSFPLSQDTEWIGRLFECAVGAELCRRYEDVLALNQTLVYTQMKILPRVLLLNETENTHPGCTLTCDIIKNEVKKWGKLIGSISTPKHNINNEIQIDYDQCDIVIVNGEGTFHHFDYTKPYESDRHQTRELYRQIQIAKKANKRVVLINALLDEVKLDFSLFDYIAVRDPFSYSWAKSIGVKTDLTLDACFGISLEKKSLYRGKSKGPIIVFDSVNAETSKLLLSFANKHSLPFQRFKKLNWKSMMKLISSSSGIITGRYHAAVFAILCGVPWICLKSNSHKMESLIDQWNAGLIINDITNISIDDIKYSLNKQSLVSWDTVQIKSWSIFQCIQKGIGIESIKINKKPNSKSIFKKIRRIITPKKYLHNFALQDRLYVDSHNNIIHWNGYPLTLNIGIPTNKDTTAVIVATGPSLLNIKPASLTGKKIWALNGAISALDKWGVIPDYWVVSDKDFPFHRFELVKDTLLRKPHCFLYTSVFYNIALFDPTVLAGVSVTLIDHPETPFQQERRNLSSLKKIENTGAIQLSDEVDYRHGLGFSFDYKLGIFGSKTVVVPAIQLARQFGCGSIYVLGMDLTDSALSVRAYDEGSAPAPSFISNYYETDILPACKLISKIVKSQKWEIFNVSMQSRLPDSVWQKISPSDF